MHRIVAAQNILVHHFGDEAVILNLNNETYYRLNGMAMHMWQALTSSQSIDEAQTALLAEYDVAADELRNDLEQFIAYLQQANLIEIQTREAV
jgi:hypothetical protein